jgi:Zn-dependent protease with chaperone function
VIDMPRRRLTFPLVLAALMIGGASMIATSEVRYRVDLSSLVEMWGDVFRDADKVGLTITRVSDRREMEMGAELAKPLEIFVVDDAQLQKYVEDVGARLAAHAGRRAIAYRFRVINMRGINAFALPGGNIFVTRQMMNFVKSEAELAAVIAHEISHVDLRHCIERFQYELLVRRVLPSDLAALSRLPYDLLRVSYNKQQEREADIDAVVTAAKAGYHPKYALAPYERMAALANEGPRTGPAGTPTGELGTAVSEAIADYFRTHPPMADRIGQIGDALQRNETAWKERTFYVGRDNHVRHISRTEQPLDAEQRPYAEPPALADYLLLKSHFKALAVHPASGLSGVAADQPTPSAAMEGAVGACEKKIKPCRLYAVGDTVVDNMRPDDIDAVVSKYLLSGRIGRAFSTYLAATDFKALFVDASTGESGTGLGMSTTAAAIEEASARCSERSAACTLYAVGDVVVQGLSGDQADAAIERYRRRVVTERIAKLEEAYIRDRAHSHFKALAVDYRSGRSAVAQAQATPERAMEEAIRACTTPTSSCEIAAIGPVRVKGATKEERDAIVREYARDVILRMIDFAAYSSQRDFKSFVVDVGAGYSTSSMRHWHPLAALNAALMQCRKEGRNCGAAMVGDRFVFGAPPDEIAREIEDYRARVRWPSDVRNPLEEYFSQPQFADFKAFAAYAGDWWRQWGHDSPYRAVEVAVARCREKNPACELYAIGNHVVYGQSEEEKNDVLALYAREVIDKRLEAFRKPEYADFKAVAGNRATMKYVIVQGRVSPADAIEQAMRDCMKQYGTCEPFALGPTAVFGLSAERIKEIADRYARDASAPQPLSH